MRKEDQKKLLAILCTRVRDRLLSKADEWPEEWDGHDIRELAYEAFRFERTRRKRDFWNTVLINNLL